MKRSGNSQEDSDKPIIRRDPEYYRALLESLEELIVRIDPRGRFTFVNDAYCRKVGKTRDELISEPFMPLVHEEDLVAVLETVADAKRPPYRTTMSQCAKTTEGHRWIEWEACAIRNDAGKIVELQGVGRDVTRRRQAVQALRESEQAERNFRRQFEALHEVNVELTKAKSLRDLFRRSIELGRELLGFDRLSVWLTADEPGVFVGTFGTDEEGQMRYEWGARIVGSVDNLVEQVISGRIPVGMRSNGPVLDHRLRKVGSGQRAVATLWDGQQIIGYVSTDNLLRREPLTENRLELLRLFASTVGHLCTRKRAEDALRDSEEAERRFREQLQELHEINAELTKAESLRELFHRAIELGRSRLGFDRLSVWLGTEEPGYFTGTFGVDEQGNLRDEWGTRTLTPTHSLTGDALKRRAPLCRKDMPVFDDKGQAVGTATQAIAPLWDGRKVIGFVATDNLISGEPITDNRMELLRLFATSVGHLCTRKRAEQELRKLHRQLMSAREAERKRLARELHDSLGQRMVLLHLSFKTILAEVAGSMEGKMLEALRQVADGCGQLVQDVRNLSHSLYPSTLEELGLYAAAEQLVRDRQAEANVTIYCPQRLRNARFPSAVETELFRIAQEALSNALRHSQAKQIGVSLDHRKGELVLAVQDDGVGLDPTKTSDKGIGLNTMRERIDVVEGTLRIRSRPGRTRIEARVPVERIKAPASRRGGPGGHTGTRKPPEP